MSLESSSQMTCVRLATPLIFTCLLAAGGSAWAQQGGNMNCTVLAGNAVNFGAYDPTVAGDLTGTGSITVNCRGAVKKGTVEVWLSAGSSNSFSARTMRHATLTGEVLTYQLFVDAALSRLWGDGTGGTSTGIIDPDVSETIAVHGRIPARQNARAGPYADTVVVTINF